MKSESRLSYIQKMQLDRSRFLLRIYRALNLDRSESIKDLSRIYQQLKDGFDGSRICQESIDQTESKEIWLDGLKKLSRMCQARTQKSRWIKNLSRCYREGREHRKIPQWIENLSRIYREKRKKAQQKDNLLRICREAIELEENEFFKGGKTHKDECDKQLINQTSK